MSAFFIPPRYLWVSLERYCEIPLWNPHNSSGIPLLATLQPGILYPPNMLFLLLPFPVAWNWLIVLHFIFAGSTTYFFLRYLKVSTLASFAGGAIFMLSGYLLSVHSLLPHLLSVGWFPLVLLYSIKHYDTRRYRHLVLSGVFLAIEFFAGAPEITLFSFFVILIISLYPMLFLRNRKVTWPDRMKPFIVLLVIFTSLVAVQLVPFYELKLQSIRSSGLSYGEATIWSFSWKDFILFFLPDAFGYGQSDAKYWANQSWLKSVYLGMAPFVLSLFFFCSRDGRRLIMFILAAVSMLFALGGNTPLYHLLYHVPPFNAIRYPVKFLFVFFFVISVTSAFGIDKVRLALSEDDRKVRTIVLTLFCVGLVSAGVWGYVNFFTAEVSAYLDAHNVKPDQYNTIWFNLHNLKRFLLFSFFFCSALFLYMYSKHKNWLLHGMIFLLVADLFLANYGYYQAVSWQAFSGKHRFVPLIAATKQTERYFVTNRTHSELETYAQTDRSLLSAPYAPLFGLYAIEGIEVMRVAHHDLFLNMLLGATTLKDAKRYIDIAGIRFMITSYRINDPDFTLLEQVNVGKGTAYLYEYTRYPGRFLLFGKVHATHSEQQTVTALLDRNVDLRKELVTSLGTRPENVERGAPVGEVTLVSYRPNSVMLQSNSSSNAFLYMSDTYYPGWRAYVDGKETKIYRANLAFRAIEVPKGRHTVVFRYVPVSFYIGLVLTLLGIALCIWLWRRDGRKAVALGSGQGNETPGDAVSGT